MPNTQNAAARNAHEVADIITSCTSLDARQKILALSALTELSRLALTMDIPTVPVFIAAARHYFNGFEDFVTKTAKELRTN